MSTMELSKEKIVEILESKSPKSLTEVYRLLGGGNKLSGSTAKKLRETAPGIEGILAGNKAGTAKSERLVAMPKEKRVQKAVKKVAKSPRKSTVDRHPKNPFRAGSSYGLLVDLIASAGSKGIGKPDLIRAFSKASGKDETHARYDLAVILSASTDSERKHRSCRDGFALIREGDHLRIKFD